MSTEYASQPPESKCGLDSHPKEEQHREDQYLERPYISSTNTERSTFQSRLTHNSTNACRLPTVTGQTSPSGSFFNPDAHSTPQIPFETVRFISRNPLLEDVPSISDESPDLRSSHASPGLSRNEQFDVSISGFTLVRTLGCGAYGKVLLGHLDSHYARNLHAIKFLRKGDMNRYGAEEVKRELRTLRWIADTTKSHTTGNRDVLFLQKMTQSFQNERYAFIVLEYHPVSLENLEIAGRLRLQAPPSSDSLSGSVLLPLGFSPSCLQGNARDPVVNLRFLAAELVLALRFLHGNGIVHQDVKPGNVMVSADGHIVLSDFGASIALPFSLDYDDLPVSFSPEVSIRKTYHPVVLQGDDIVTFTPSYAAPELLRRNGADLVIYDERVDWFSLGMLLYELATGSLPFQADYWAREPRIRRSTNDFSLAFGELENLSHASNNCGPDPSLKSIKPLESFLKALLVHQANDRLSGEDVKLHPFFHPVSAIWDEISDMMHPPLPRPPLSPVGSDVSLSMKAGASWGSRSSENENLLVVDDLYNEAGLRIVWSKVGCNDDSEGNADKAEPGGVDGELGRIGDRVVSNLNSAGLSSKHIPLPDDAHGMVFLPRSHTLDTIEDMSEIQPFPSTASIMFLGTDEYKGEGPPPGGFASSSPNPSVPTMPPPGCVIRRLVPSFCSAQDSGVDLSYDPDVNSCMEADMSYSVDFAEVRSKDTISIASTKDHHEVREEASIFSSRPSLHCLPYPRSPGQMRPLSTVMMPEATLSDSPVSCSPTTFTRRNSFAHGKHDEKPGSNRSIPQTQSASAKNVQVFTPLGAGAGPTKRIHHVHPSIPPVSRFNRSRPSLPMTSPSVTKHRSRRCSLPATYRQAQNEGHCSIQRNSYAGRSASHNPPNELGMQTSPRSRRMSESWTLEEELTISVLNAMEFPRLDHGLCNGESGRTTTHGSLPNRREIQTSRTRRTALSIFGSIRRRTGDQGRVSTPFITPAVATASTEPSQGRKRRRSFLMKRQQRPTSSSEVAPPPSPKKALGKFLKKLRQLSGLASL